MARSYWLVKSEPEAYGWGQLVAEKRTRWTGVRYFTARNHLAAMKAGDLVFYYHSGGGKQVVAGVVVEGASALVIPAERFTVLVVTPESLGERPARDERLGAAADFIVVVQRGGASSPGSDDIAGRLGKSVPVVSVSHENENWAVDALLKEPFGAFFSELTRRIENDLPAVCTCTFHAAVV